MSAVTLLVENHEKTGQLPRLVNIFEKFQFKKGVIEARTVEM